MTGPEHYRKAEQLIEQAGAWMDADWGWKAGLSTEERLAYRTADLAEAQVHATLAHAAATALQVRGADATEWERTAGSVVLTRTPPTALDIVDGRHG